MSNIYKSSLVAHLTSPSYSKTVGSEDKYLNLRNQVDTLEELVASDDFSWGIVNYGAADYQLFSTSEVTLRLLRSNKFSLSKGGALQANL